MPSETNTPELNSFDFAEGTHTGETTVTFLPATMSRDLQDELDAWETASDDDLADVIAHWLN